MTWALPFTVLFSKEQNLALPLDSLSSRTWLLAVAPLKRKHAASRLRRPDRQQRAATEEPSTLQSVHVDLDLSMHRALGSTTLTDVFRSPRCQVSSSCQKLASACATCMGVGTVE